MIKVLLSEWLKTKRTAVRWATLCMPLVFSLFSAVYLSIRPDSSQKFAFEGFFTIWTVFVIPLGVGVLSGLIVDEEELAGNFNGFLLTGISRTKLYLGKFLLMFFCLSSCTFIAVLILCIGISLGMKGEIFTSVFVMASIFIVVGALPILAIHLWLSFAWGMGASIGMSIGGILMSALFGLTGLGTKIWQFIPWTWPIKLGMLPGIYFSDAIQSNLKRELLSNIKQTMIIGGGSVLFWLTVILIGSVIWFNIWEGRKNYG